MEDTNHQTVIVTGGATGIGYAVAEQFVRRGANVFVNGRTEAKLRAAADRLGEPARVGFLACDVTAPTNADRIIDAARDRFGRVDVLVNNAGIFHCKAFTDYGIDELDSFLGYLRGMFALTQAAVRQMRRQGGGGAIINISTILAFNGIAAFPSSAPMAAKGGITALTKNLSIELAADNIASTPSRPA